MADKSGFTELSVGDLVSSMTEAFIVQFTAGAAISKGDPVYLSGDSQVSPTTAAQDCIGVALYAQAPITVPPRFLSCDWIAFWYRTDNITDLSSLTIKLLVDSSNYAEYTFTSEIVQANKWYRVRFKRADCTITGSVDWDEITAVKIEQTHNTLQTINLWLDEICAYQ